MRTRTTEYSEKEKIVTTEELIMKKKELLNIYKKLDNKTTAMGRIEYIIKMMNHTIKNIDIYIKFQKTYPLYDSTYITTEIFLEYFLLKKKHFQEDLKSVDIIKNEEYEKKYNILLKICDKGNKKIYNYLNYKYSIILFKTNRDIYRNVLSYII
jgi:hypothetical protein